MTDFTGEFAAVGAALAFSLTSTMFTLAGRNYSPSIVMRASLPVGLVCLTVVNWLITGTAFPTTQPMRWLWLGLSGIIGFWLGSLAIVNAFLSIGPRLTLLITAIAPILGTILAWLFLDQQLAPDALVGILVTISGIGFVVTGRRGSTGSLPNLRSFRTGAIFALLAACGQATSFVLTTEGVSLMDPTNAQWWIAPLRPVMVDALADFTAGLVPIHPITASLMRLIVGTAAIWLATIFAGQARRSLQITLAYQDSLRYLLVGAIAGPVVGASLVTVSLTIIPVGIASTLANLTPIFLIPISALVFKEQISVRAVVGTLIALCGTAILFL